MNGIGRRRIRNAGGADATAVIADPVTVAEQPQAVTQVIDQPQPEVTEVIIQPEPPAPELAAIATEEELRLFGGRPLSSSVTVRDAWFKANPGPEQIFGSLVADLAAWRQDTTDSGPGAVQPPAGEVAGSTTAAQASPEAPGPVNDETGEDGRAAGQASPAASGTASSTRRPPRKRSKGAGA